MAVLAFLRLAAGQGLDDGWVNGDELTDPVIGGSEGLRRVRELRQHGYTIERRPNPRPGTTGWQYRLIEAPADYHGEAF